MKCFVSSTVHDLKDLRDILDRELSNAGFEMLLSEKGTIPVDSSQHSYEDCLKAASECDVLIAVIDGRYGGDMPDGKRSVTFAEVEAALEAGKQVKVFVRRAVWDAKEILRPYLKSGVEFRPSKIVGDVRVFGLLDDIRKRPKGNWIFQFETPTDIIEQLSKQLGFTLNKPQESTLESLDKIIARKLRNVFPNALIEHLSLGLQVGKVSCDAIDQIDDALDFFSPESMRFGSPGLNEALEAFLSAAQDATYEAPSVFTYSRQNEDYFMWFRGSSVEAEMQMEGRRQHLASLAVTMEKEWRDLFAKVRTSFPELIAELHQQHSN